MKQTIRLPYPPPALSPNKKQHWAKKAKAVKAYRWHCRLMCMEQKIKKMTGPLKVKITIGYPDKRRRDWDNAISSFKAGQDAVAKFIGVDDYLWGKPEYVPADVDGYIEVDLEELEDG